MSNNDSPVTRTELAAHIRSIDCQLKKVPSRWEVRFLILAGFVGAQLIPVPEIARAAISVLPL